jgi:hypothetical protein
MHKDRPVGKITVFGAIKWRGFRPCHPEHAEWVKAAAKLLWPQHNIALSGTEENIND